MDKTTILVSLVMLSIFLNMQFVSANTYEIEFYNKNTSTSTISTFGLSFPTTESCEIRLSTSATLVGSSYDVGAVYYSPGSSNPIIFDTLTNQNNLTCKTLGVAEYGTSYNNIYEGKNILTYTGTSGYATISNKYTCETSNVFLNVSLRPYIQEDQYGNSAGRYRELVNSPPETFAPEHLFGVDNHSYCNTELSIAEADDPFSAANTADRTISYYYPFNVSGGKLIYDVDTGNATDKLIEVDPDSSVDITCVAKLSLVDYNTGSKIQLHRNTDAAAGGNLCELYDLNYGGIINFGSADLDKKKALILEVGLVSSATVVGTFEINEPPLVQLDVMAYHAEYECESWSDCDGISEYRLCEDPLDIADSIIESRTCSRGVLENATLGFEYFVREDDIYKCSPYWFFGQGYYLNQTYRDTPENWTIGENDCAKRDFLKMTEEWATEGSRSLKMWYIPPKQGEVILNSSGCASSCGNVTGGTLPYVYQNMSNTSFSINYNVTFPGENMLISFDVKGCPNQVMQHSSFSPLTWGNTSIIQYWPDVCYANTCSGTPDSRYFFNILDTISGLSIFGTPYYDTASINLAETKEIDLSGLGLIAGREYTLTFAVYPENLDDRNGNCVYFDNVRYERTSEEFLSVVGGVCESDCIGEDYYEAKVLSNGNCVLTKTPLGCLENTIRESMENGEDVCKSDGITLLKFNEKAGQHDEIECEYGCENGACSTEEIQGDPTTTSDTLGTDMLAFLGQPFTWALIITIISIILSALFLGLYGGMKDARIPMGIGLCVNIFFIVAEWTPFWWGVMISAGLIILISGKIADLSGMGGG